MQQRKRVIAEKEGEFSITVEFDDLSTRTFHGIRRMTTRDIGHTQTHWAVVLVVVDNKIQHWVIDMFREAFDNLGEYFIATNGKLPKATICKCEMSADPTEDEQQDFGERSMAG